MYLFFVPFKTLYAEPATDYLSDFHYVYLSNCLSYPTQLEVTDRNTDWVNLNLRYTFDVMNGANAIRRFPGFLAP